MKESDIRTKLLLEIDNMYIVSVLEGKYTRHGSFIAIDEQGKDFFANQQLVGNKSELIKMLNEKVKPLWVLVKDEIWGGKWNNKLVSEIRAISEQKNVCEEYRTILIRQLQLKYELIDIRVQHTKLIEDSFGKPSFDEEESILKGEISGLQQKLSELMK